MGPQASQELGRLQGSYVCKLEQHVVAEGINVGGDNAAGLNDKPCSASAKLRKCQACGVCGVCGATGVLCSVGRLCHGPIRALEERQVDGAEGESWAVGYVYSGGLVGALRKHQADGATGAAQTVWLAARGPTRALGESQVGWTVGAPGYPAPAGVLGRC